MTDAPSDRNNRIVKALLQQVDEATHDPSKGDKSGEQSVSNTLSALKKANTIGNPDGKYVAA